MLRGDISNEIPRRLLVTYEAITKNHVEDRKFLGLKTGTTTRRKFDLVALNRLWRYTERAPLRIELVNFGVTDDEADKRLARLDMIGTNPVNYSRAYDDLQDLIGELPYRPEVLGVIDIPENQARYGLRGVGLDHLDRAL